MARKFDTTNIVSPVQARFSKRSLTHINTAYDELGGSVVNGMLGTYTTNDVVILHGCVVTAIIPGTSSVTAGSIYYNGRVYEVDADASIITTGAQTLVWQIAETTIAGDPATFDDGNTYDFHIIEKMELAAGAVGSGVNAFSDYNGTAIRYISVPFSNQIVVVSTSSNLSSITPRLEAVKTGDTVTGTLRISAVVTTGATASSVSIDLPAGIVARTTLYTVSTTYTLVGAVHVTASTLQPLVCAAIRNGRETTDAWIGTSGRLNVSLVGSIVADGSTIVIVVPFTAMCSN